MTEIGLVWLVLFWFCLLGTLPLVGFVGQSGEISGDRELNQLGVP